MRFECNTGVPHLQENAPDPSVRLCLGSWGDPRGVGVLNERGTPVPHTAVKQGGNTLNGVQDFRTENGSSPGQNLASAGFFLLRLLDTGVPRSHETTPPLGPPQGPRHRATVGSYGVCDSYEQGTPVADRQNSGIRGKAGEGGAH